MLKSMEIIRSGEINQALSKLTDVVALLDVSAQCAEGHAERLAVCRDLQRVVEVCSDMVSEAMEKIERNLEGFL